MKTYCKDFSMNDNSLVGGSRELEEVICNRQEKFKGTEKYLKAKEEAMAALKEIEILLPEEGRALGNLEDLFYWLECICYSAAYRDGMTDLMAAMTLNKLGITRAEHIRLSEGNFHE